MKLGRFRDCVLGLSWLLAMGLVGDVGRNALGSTPDGGTGKGSASANTRVNHPEPCMECGENTGGQDKGEPAGQDDAAALWKAAREGDLDGVRAALDRGVAVDAATAYGATALSFAADRGHQEIVQLLLARGADPNVKDSFYGATPLTWAQSNDHVEVIGALLAAGAEGADRILLQAMARKRLELAQAAVHSRRIPAKLLALAKRQMALWPDEEQSETAWVELFADVDDQRILGQLTEQQQAALDGEFEMAGGNFKLTFSREGDQLLLAWGNAAAAPVIVVDSSELYLGQNRLRVHWEGDQVEHLSANMGGNAMTFRRPGQVAEEAGEAAAGRTRRAAGGRAGEAGRRRGQPAESPRPLAEPGVPHPGDLAVSSPNWPSFRGTAARGIAEGQRPPVKWDGTQNENVLWRTSIGGLGNSCPVIWDRHLYLTTAVSEDANLDVRIGLYGDVDSVEDDSVYEFKVLCLDKWTGQQVWERTVHTGQPAVKRHSKSSHANPTVATDGQHVVAFFGAEGLYCFESNGELKWQKDLGFLDSGWFFDPGYQWGFGSSPIIFEDRVVVQCDIQEGSFVAAFDLQSGTELWRTGREEIPTWPTPTVHRFGDVPMLLTHGTRAARGYDVRDGQLLWELPGHSEIVVPTPFVARDLIFLASGYSPIQPIIALRPSARGQIELRAVDPLADDSMEEQDPGLDTAIAWSKLRGGPYMPTPIAYGDYLYVCANNGILTCYELETGQEVYRERMRIGGTSAFTASPVAGDGHLYFTAEDGRVAVVRAGPDYDLVEVNPAGNTVMATPAISEGVLFLRTINELIAFGSPDEST